MLDAAGVAHRAVAPDCDEAAVKARHRGEAASLALTLAEAKARSVPGDDWVIGADSVLEVDGVRYSKPVDRDQAAVHLRAFSGRVMTLSSAAALARGGTIEWAMVDTAQLSVRDLSDDFIAAYLDAEWPAVSYCVGVFRFEGIGVQLFDAVEGSQFTIFGLPLLPLLGALRVRGLMAA